MVFQLVTIRLLNKAWPAVTSLAFGLYIFLWVYHVDFTILLYVDYYSTVRELDNVLIFFCTSISCTMR